MAKDPVSFDEFVEQYFPPQSFNIDTTNTAPEARTVLPSQDSRVVDMVRFFIKYNVAGNRLEEVANAAIEFGATMRSTNAQNWWDLLAKGLMEQVGAQDLDQLIKKL